MSNITEKIFKEIKDRNLNVSAFANEIGVSRDTVYNFADDTIKYSTIKKVAEILKLPVSFFIADEEPKKQKGSKNTAKGNNLTTLANRQRELINELNFVAREMQKEVEQLKKVAKQKP